MESAVLNALSNSMAPIEIQNENKGDAILTVDNFSASFGTTRILRNVNMTVNRNTVIAVLGPSGCGKTTFMRCINRMHELAPGASVEGKMIYDSHDVYGMNPVILRSHIGMVFQRPNPFPSMSTYENVIAGYIFNEIKLNKSERDEIVESYIKKREFVG